MVKKYKLTGNTTVNQSGGSNFEVIHPLYPSGFNSTGVSMNPTPAIGVANLGGSNLSVGIGMAVPQMLFPPTSQVNFNGATLPRYGMIGFNNTASAPAPAPAPAPATTPAPAPTVAKVATTSGPTVNTDKLQRQIKDLTTKMEQLSSERKTLETQLFQCEQGGRVREREVEALKSKLLANSQEIQKCNGELANCQTQISTKDTEIYSKSGAIKVFTERVRENEANISRINAELASAKRDLQSCQQQLAAKTSSGKADQALLDQITTLQTTIARLDREKEEIRTNADIELNTEKAEKNQLASNLEKALENTDAIRQELTRATAENNVAKIEIKRLQGINTDLKAQIDKCTDDLRKCDVEKARIQTELNTKLEQLKRASDSEKETLKSEAKELAQAKANLQGEKNRLGSQIVTLTEELNKTKAEGEEAIKKYTALSATKGNLEIRLSSQTEEITKLRGQLKEAVEKLSSNGGSDAEIANLRSEIERLEGEIASKNSAFELEKSRLRELYEQQKGDLVKAHGIALSASQAETDAIRVQIGALTEKANKCEAELKALQDRLARGEELTTELRGQIIALTTARDAALAEIDRLQAKPKTEYPPRYYKQNIGPLSTAAQGLPIGEIGPSAEALAEANRRAATVGAEASSRRLGQAPVKTGSDTRSLMGRLSDALALTGEASRKAGSMYGGASVGMFNSAVGQVGSIQGMPSNGLIAVGSDASMKVAVPLVGNTSNVSMYIPPKYDAKEPSNFLGVPQMELPVNKLNPNSEIKLTYKEPEVKQSLMKFAPNLPYVNNGYNFNFPTILQPTEKITINPRESQARLVVESPDSDEIITISGESEKVKPVFEKLVQDNKAKVADPSKAPPYNITDVWKLDQSGINNAIKTIVPQVGEPNVTVTKESKVAAALPTMQNVLGHAARYGPNIRFSSN